MGDRTTVQDWGKVVGYQNVTFWVPNIRTITFLGWAGLKDLVVQ